MNTRRFASILAALTIAASCTVPAYADPASIDDGSGPRDVGAKIDDGSGTPGPSFDEPVTIPSVGPAPVHPGRNATPAELEAYEKARAAHERQQFDRAQAQSQERARIAAKAYRECIAAGRGLC